MQTMLVAFEETEGQMQVELEKVSDQVDVRIKAERSVAIIRKFLLQIKQVIQENGFATAEDEILFFKRLKPRLYSKLIYFHKVLQIELKRPVAGKKAEIKYLHKEQARIAHFFRKFAFLYQYCRSGAEYLDTRFFRRDNLELLPGVESYGVDTDPSFTTGYDFIVAKMKANDLLKQYLEEELVKLSSSKQSISNPVEQQLSWTASKASLIELIYGLQSTGVFNSGQAAISDVAIFMENIFHIKLGNYYRVFQEIRIRKKSRTQFLDEMKDRLIQKMDYADENPQFK